MSIFDDEDRQLVRERATREIASYKPTEFSENFGALWDEFNNNDAIGSRRAQLRDAYEQRIKTIKQITGEELDQPYSSLGERSPFRPIDDSTDPDSPDEPARFLPDFSPFALIGQLFDGVDNDLTEPQRLRAHDERIAEIRAGLHPDQQARIPTREDLEAAVNAKAQGLAARAKDIASRATLGGFVGQLAGGSAAAITEPEVLATMPVGASVRAGLLTRVLIEAAIGGSTEALLQPAVQSQRAAFGVDSGVAQAFENIGFAAGGAAGLTLAGSGLVKAIGAIRQGGAKAFEKAVGREATPEEAALAESVKHDADIEAQVPEENAGLASQVIHQEREQAAFEAALDGRVLGEESLPHDPPFEPVEMPVDGTNAVVLRNADLDGIEVDAKLMQFKAGGDDQGVTDRLQGITQWEPERAGIGLIYERADGSRLIADGHQRLGLARRLAAEGKEVEWHAIVLRESDGITPEEARARAAFKNIAEGTGSAADAAKVLRDLGVTPADLNLPPKSALVRDAEGLMKLDDDAFGMVINDVITQQMGSIIGRLVDDPRMHVSVAGLLAKLKPRTAIEAESIVRQAVESGRRTETQSSLFGDDEITESLFLERARVLDRGLRMIRRNIDTFRTLSERGEDIAEAGNILAEGENVRRLDVERMVKTYIEQQAHRKGPIGDALTEAAQTAFETGNYAEAARGFVRAVAGSIEDGGTDGRGLSGRGPDPQPERSGAEDTFTEPTDDSLELFSDPVSPESEKVSDQITAELLDDAQADAEAETDGLKDLAERIEAGASAEEIDAHPAVTQAVDEMLSIPRTDQQDGFMSPEWRGSRVLAVGDAEVQGIDNAVPVLLQAFKDMTGVPIRNERKASIVLGPPAAGKSALAEPLARDMGAVIMDSDEVKKHFQNTRAASEPMRFTKNPA